VDELVPKVGRFHYGLRDVMLRKKTPLTSAVGQRRSSGNGAIRDVSGSEASTQGNGAIRRLVGAFARLCLSKIAHFETGYRHAAN
jgi:hypothetical protein